MLKRLAISLFFLVASLLIASAATAQCNDKEFGVYQIYDRFLDQNPEVPDTTLRKVFASRIKIKPEALKDLYFRCLVRWSNERPDEARAFLRREVESFAADCKHRPTSDQICRSALGR